MQSKRMSFVEAFCNASVSFVQGVLTQLLVFPLFGIRVPLSTNMALVVIFMVVSILRTYVVRRLFNRVDPLFPHREAKKALVHPLCPHANDWDECPICCH